MKKLSVSVATTNLLKNSKQPLTVAQIAKATNKPAAQVATTLWKLKKDGRVYHNTATNTYRLSADNKLPTHAKVAAPRIEVPEHSDASNSVDKRYVDMAVKYMDALAVIRYLEGKIADRDVNA
jgi:hypothetical protein